jgi:hypothetical protein
MASNDSVEAMRLAGRNLSSSRERHRLWTALLAIVAVGAGLAEARAADLSILEGFRRTETRYLTFYHRDHEDADRFIKVADAFIEYVHTTFLPASPDRHITVFLAGDFHEYRLYSLKLFQRENAPTFGSYYPADGIVATSDDTGLGTVTSLLMYSLIDAQRTRPPRWARVAMATFFEKVFAYPHEGKLVFQVGYQNPWRLHELSGCLDRLDLERILTEPGYFGGQSHYRLVAMFLWDHGRFQAFARTMGDPQPSRWANPMEAAFDMPMSEIVPLWRAYLSRVEAEFDTLMRVPVSQAYSSEAEFRKAVALPASSSAWIHRLLDGFLPKLARTPCPLDK